MDQFENSELISAYLDGEVTPAEREEVERLLETSPQWRSKLDQFSRLSELVRDVPRASAPPDLAATVQRRLNPLPTASLAISQTRSLRREWLAGLAGMAVTLLGGFVALQVMNMNRAADERLATPHGDVMFTTENAPSLAAFRDDSTTARSEFLARELLSRESEVLLQENQSYSLVANAGDVNGNTNLTAPASAPAQFGTDADGYAQDFSYQSVANQPKDQLRIGDVLTAFEHLDGVVFVVELAVVDMNEAGGELELVLARNGLKVLSEAAPEDSLDAEVVPFDTPASADAKPDTTLSLSRRTPQLKMMYVTAPRVTISQVLDELGKQQVVAQARLQAPVPAAADLETSERLTERVNRVGDQAAAQEQTEETLFNEAVVAGQNYGLTQQTVSPAKKPVQEARALKQFRRNAGEQKAQLADVAKRRVEQNDKKSKDSHADAPQARYFAKNTLSQLQLSNSAVPMTLNLETGEVTYLNFDANGRSNTRKLSINFQEKTDAAAAKSEWLDDGRMKEDETAPVDAAIVAGSPSGDQSTEPTIRVLFVVKQTEPSAVP